MTPERAASLCKGVHKIRQLWIEVVVKVGGNLPEDDYKRGRPLVSEACVCTRGQAVRRRGPVRLEYRKQDGRKANNDELRYAYECIQYALRIQLDRSDCWRRWLRVSLPLRRRR